MEKEHKNSLAKLRTMIATAEERKTLAIESGMTGYDEGYVDGMVEALRLLEEMRLES